MESRVVSSREIALGQIDEGDQLDGVAIDRIAHARTGKDFDFELRGGDRRNFANVGGRMKIQLGGAVAELVDHAEDIVLVEMPALMKSEQRISGAEPAIGHHPA